MSKCECTVVPSLIVVCVCVRMCVTGSAKIDILHKKKVDLLLNQILGFLNY